MLRVCGVLFVVVVTVAITEPAIAALCVTLVSGLLLILGGMKYLIAASRVGGKYAIFNFVVGVAYLVGGFYCLTHPLLPLTTAIFPYTKATRGGGRATGVLMS